jgi:hypothetical protein
MPHELSNHLGRRAILRTASFDELVPKRPVYSDPVTAVLRFHTISVAAGYTNVFPKSVVSGDRVVIERDRSP